MPLHSKVYHVTIKPAHLQPDRVHVLLSAGWWGGPELGLCRRTVVDLVLPRPVSGDEMGTIGGALRALVLALEAGQDSANGHA